MSLHNLAEHIRSQGRGEDTMLIHMTPKEVAGLQALARHHGGSLTINPKTGLPEAGFLSKILPILAGVGLSFVPGVGPLAAAALVGGGGALATGSLSKGLMMGLGAFGGAGLAGGIAAAGISSLVGAGGAAAEGALASGAAGIEGTAAANALPSAAQLAATSNAGSTLAANNAASMAMGQRAATAAAQTLPTAPIQGTPNIAQAFMNNASSFPGAISKAVQNPTATMNGMPGPFSGPVNTAMYGGAALAPAVMSPNLRYKMPNSDGGEEGSVEMPKLGSNFYSQPMYSGSPNPIQYPYKTHFSGGGITSLGSYSDGGQLAVGPGDGMSDSIPARMSSGQEARLTDGEFVVPADVVSGLGNGSTKAGSELLYNMLDKVRKARTGKKTQPKAAPMHRMLPV